MNFIRITYWTPRILGIALIFFVSLFALDAFKPDPNLQGLLMHLLPTIFLAIVLIIAWKKPLIGGILYMIISVYYGVKALEHLNWILVIGLPVFVIGMLFILSYWMEKDKQ